MKLLSFGPKGQERPGLLVGEDRILDLSAALPENPRSMRELLEQGLPESFSIAENASQEAEIAGPKAEIAGPKETLPLSGVRLAAPVPEPSKILCIGLNYRDHAEEQNKPLPKKPLVFAKAPSAVIGPGEEIVLPDPELETFTDAEAELAVVIGRAASRVSEAEAYKYVAGYTLLNDVSGRDTQWAEKQWLRAKSFDTFSPMGPWIVTKDEIPDPHALDIIGRVNSEVRQKSNTQNLHFTVPFLVSYLSQTMTLLPGDVIATGTPGGVGIYRDPKVRLEAGDVVTVEIREIGVLENKVAAS